MEWLVMEDRGGYVLSAYSFGITCLVLLAIHALRHLRRSRQLHQLHGEASKRAANQPEKKH